MSQRLARLVVCAILAVAAMADSPPLDPGAHYDACLDAARRAPADGLTSAEDWRRAGGGFPADHCAAVALFGLKRYAEAAARFEALAGAMMTEPAGLRAGAAEEAGQAWLLAAQPLRARAAFDAATRFTPSDPAVYIDRARADADLKDFKTAIADLNSALALSPGNPLALVYRASAERQLDDLATARKDIDAALKSTPDDTAGLLERGNIRSLQGDAKGARADWLRIVTLAPDSPAANAARDNLAALGPAPQK